MQMRWPCPVCGASLRAEIRHAGRRTRCPKCRNEVTIPAAEAGGEREGSAGITQRDERLGEQGSGIVKGGLGAGGRSGTKDRPTGGSHAPESEDRQPWEEMAAPSDQTAADFLDNLSEPTASTPSDDDDAPFVPPTAAGASKAPKPPKSAKPAPRRAAAEDESGKLSPAAAPKKQNQSRQALWITVGAVAAALLIAVGLLVASGAFSSGRPVVEPSAPAGPPMLVVEWPQADRGFSRLILDDTSFPVTDQRSPLEYKLTPGQHKLHLRRLGSAPIDVVIPPQKDGQRYTYKPDWKPGTEADKAAVAALLADDSSPANAPTSTSDRPVTESLLEVKKWEVDLEASKKDAQQGKKDLLLLFFGADRRDWCLKLTKEVLLKPNFRKFADPRFVYVLFEAPGPKFDDGSTGAKLATDFRITSFPMLVLADSDGLPYAEQDYMDPAQHDYVKSLKECLGKRTERDKVYEPTKNGTDEEKLAAADKFVKWLEDNHMVKLYDTKLKEWVDLADRVDPKNERGLADKFFLAGWEAQLRDVADKGAPEILPVAEQLEKFRQKHKFKDTNHAAELHLEVARLFAMKGDRESTMRFLHGAAECGPTDKRLRRYLEGIAGDANAPISSGSGFVIADGGYLVTNNHVVVGDGHLWVRFAGEEKEIRATTIATDPEHDIALVKLDEMPKTPLKPLMLSGKTPGPGADIGVFGYPLGDILGGGLKFTFGKISAPPDKGRDGMYLLDCKVNHGNSGGPMCDARGQVVGLVSAKTTSYGGNDSYGMALPADAIATFLKAHLPNFKPAPPDSGKNLGAWDEVYGMVGPSVVMMLKRTN